MVTISFGLDTVAVEFTFDAKIDNNSERVKFYKTLYGFKDIQKGKRVYVREGVLSGIRHLRPTRSTVIVSRRDSRIVRNFLKKNKGVKFDEKMVILGEGEGRALGLNQPTGWKRIYEELKGNENTVFSVDF
ncbi:MAG: hypothetical protein Q8P81_04065 [Nanoarchaeota archaeon]|nr:hypothetical protein [Nanoarchaeota archaeon]